MLQQPSFMRLIRRLWLLVACAIALGGIKSHELVEIVHAHPYDPAVPHAYLAWEDPTGGSPDGESSPASEEDVHSHWLPIVEEIPGMAGFQSRVCLSAPDSVHLSLGSKDLRGSSRPTDLLKRPPRLG